MSTIQPLDGGFVFPQILQRSIRDDATQVDDNNWIIDLVYMTKHFAKGGFHDRKPIGPREKGKALAVTKAITGGQDHGQEIRILGPGVHEVFHHGVTDLSILVEQMRLQGFGSQHALLPPWDRGNEGA